MRRITTKPDAAIPVVAADQVIAREDGTCTGPAIEALARYEDALELVEQQLACVAQKLDAHKQRGSLRTATAQQLLAQKLTYASILSAMDASEG